MYRINGMDNSKACNSWSNRRSNRRQTSLFCAEKYWQLISARSRNWCWMAWKLWFEFTVSGVGRSESIVSALDAWFRSDGVVDELWMADDGSRWNGLEEVPMDGADVGVVGDSERWPVDEKRLRFFCGDAAGPSSSAGSLGASELRKDVKDDNRRAAAAIGPVDRDSVAELFSFCLGMSGFILSGVTIIVRHAKNRSNRHRSSL